MLDIGDLNKYSFEKGIYMFQFINKQKLGRI